MARQRRFIYETRKYGLHTHIMYNAVPNLYEPRRGDCECGQNVCGVCMYRRCTPSAHFENQFTILFRVDLVRCCAQIYVFDTAVGCRLSQHLCVTQYGRTVCISVCECTSVCVSKGGKIVYHCVRQAASTSIVNEPFLCKTKTTPKICVQHKRDVHDK